MDCTKTKLYHFLAALDPRSGRQFGEFLQSPLFNKDNHHYRLSEVFLQHIGRQTDRPLPSEKVWKKMGRKDAYNDTRFRKYCSDALSLGRQFMALDHYMQRPLDMELAFLTEVTDKKITKLYSFQKKVAQRVDDTSCRSSDYHLSRYRFEKLKFDLEGYVVHKTDLDNINQMQQELDGFYIAEKLKWACETLGRELFFRHSYDLQMIDECIGNVAANMDRYEDFPSVMIYYYACVNMRNLTDEEDRYYYDFKRSIDRYITAFGESEMKEIYTLAVNTCLIKSSRGRIMYQDELLEVYKSMIKYNAIFEDDGNLLPSNYRNITTIALRTGQIEWAEDFVNTYSDYLPANSRESIMAYGRALLYLYQKDYHRLILELQRVEYDDLVFSLNAKILMIMGYYELDEYEALYSFLGSFQTFLNRHKDISEAICRTYLKLIKYTRRLLKIIPGDDKAIEKLRLELKADERAIPNSNWLAEKLAELDK